MDHVRKNLLLVHVGMKGRDVKGRDVKGRDVKGGCEKEYRAGGMKSPLAPP
jgi:hypothetical protein